MCMSAHPDIPELYTEKQRLKFTQRTTMEGSGFKKLHKQQNR